MSTTESTPDQVETEVVIDPNAVSLTINGKTVAARKGELIIAAADRTSDFIPRFCYHPRMKPVGMCRQCLVEVEGPRGPMMVVSCMTPVAEGQVVHTETEQVKKAQEGILELLLANHPLDCPVCDKGGECPLQDQAFSHGPGESRYVEEKRHYEKPIPISDLVFLDRERCILCDRCTRFASEVAGDPLISFTHRGNNTQVLTFPDEPFASYFSGNTVQICPVGALTAKPYRFKARPWDLEETQSTCTSCSVGCATVIQSSRDQVLRFQGHDNDEVNWGWLCDRGRFNFESINSEDRFTTPLVKENTSLVPTSWSKALEVAARTIRMAVSAKGANSVAILGGARLANEDARAWAMLASKSGITMHDAQLDDGLSTEVFDLPQATINDATAATTVILLSPDLKEELPVLYLRLRDAATKNRTRIIEFTTKASGLTRYAWKSVNYEPGAQVAAVTAALNDSEIASQMRKGNVVVVLGRANLAESSDFTAQAYNAIAAAFPAVTVLPVLRRGNIRGAAAAGLTSGNNARSILTAASEGHIECLILLGADPLSDVPDLDLARRALAGAQSVIAVDTFPTASTLRADVVLPAAAYAERGGTTTNLEGRVLPLSQKITARGTSRPDWMIATELAEQLGADIAVESIEDLTEIEVPAQALQALSVVGSSAPERNSYDLRLVLSRK
ncbi:MAG: NADH-quinone oxidoreductase subunit NuoG, partial [Actinobacteria bacterium]|nr:NADH-quinone oxidoreductase subunit NuoG [Actinomycetota bacterium]